VSLVGARGGKKAARATTPVGVRGEWREGELCLVFYFVNIE